ncbi:MAG: SusC/RagA family TonB-linked outer membrane protein, partial [Muribaculaceae bacterium]|nr:SusC/RagA family TonB-linked outer membrane protein [Muribaculaceae bacterium]
MLAVMAVTMVIPATAQDNPVTGTVTTSDGEPLAGVTVMVEGSKTGTSTGIDGDYTIKATNGKYLTFSYVGFKKERVKVNGQSKINVVLTEDNNMLDEVVAIGYGKQRRRNIVGAVENVSGKEIEGRPNGYVIRSLQGMVPGLNIQMNDGKPTRSAAMQIRATTQSIGAGGSALCLIDGVEADITAMNPEDIESISVLKDASSTAVYGARGAFGVILVTTKNAKKGKTQVDYSGSVSFISETNRPELVTDAYTWYQSFQEAYYNAFHQEATTINNKFPISQAWKNEFIRRRTDPDNSYTDWAIDANGEYQYYGEGTNWYDLIYKKQTTGTQHNLRISGGSDVASYIVSARYFEQDGIYKVGDEKFRQFNVRGKGTIQITPRLKVENNTDFVRRTYKQPLSGHSGQLIRRNLEHQGFPMTVPKNPDGTWTYAGIYTGYASMAEGAAYRNNFKFDMKNSTFGTYDILK